MPLICLIGVFALKTVEERLRSYEPLWENWTYTGEFLGEGAMSSVFEIQSTAMGLRELAALKIITVKKNMHGEVRIPETALNEIKILRALSGCPNIVHYHDSTQRQIYDEANKLCEIDILIKMEKLKSLSEGENLSEEQVIKLGKDMCNALSHAAEHGIIHRDIKPQNIFVDSEGTYKLGDFGIAKIVSEYSHHYTMNIGTLAYTAPEVQGSTTGKYDISSDIYSLGLVLYVFLNNGYLPFADSLSSIRDAIAKRLAGVPFPSPMKGSKSLKTIVMRACANDVVKRYKNPKEMFDDLELLSTGGKKMVVDPFATLDANIDTDYVAYDEKPVETSFSTASSHYAAETGISSSAYDMSRPYSAAHSSPSKGYGTSTMSGFSKPASSTLDETPIKSKAPATATSTATGATDSGTGATKGGLKMTLNSKASSKTSAPTVKPIHVDTTAHIDGAMKGTLKTTMKKTSSMTAKPSVTAPSVSTPSVSPVTSVAPVSKTAEPARTDKPDKKKSPFFSAPDSL